MRHLYITDCLQMNTIYASIYKINQIVGALM